MKTTEKKCRNLNIDLIRCFAIFSVVSVHFFLNNGFYEETIILYERLQKRKCSGSFI